MTQAASGAAGSGDGTGGLRVDPALAAFVADELLAGVDRSPEWFWSTLAGLHGRFAPRATNGTRCSAHTRTAAATCAASRGSSTSSGTTRYPVSPSHS